MKIVAEAGTGHEKSLDKAKSLVENAKKCGADCVKFQWVYADEILHPATGFVKLPTGNISLYQRFKELEVNPDFFYKIKEFCADIDIEFMCSPFGPKSLSELIQLEPNYIKIASPELNYVQILEQLKNENIKNIPIVLSSGVSKLSDIETALSVLNDKNVILLHCITCYPAPEEEYNVRLVKNLNSIFGVKTGLSDHSLHPYLVPLLTLSQGGTMIEKHFTLNNEGQSLDDPIALNCENFKCMVSKIRQAENETSSEIILELKNEFGSEKIEKILGSGQKKLAESEKANYTRTNRSLRFVKDLSCGQKITLDDVKPLRTEKVLKVGLEPKFLDTVIGAKVTKDVKSGDAVNWDCLILR